MPTGIAFFLFVHGFSQEGENNVIIIRIGYIYMASKCLSKLDDVLKISCKLELKFTNPFTMEIQMQITGPKSRVAMGAS